MVRMKRLCETKLMRQKKREEAGSGGRRWEKLALKQRVSAA